MIIVLLICLVLQFIFSYKFFSNASIYYILSFQPILFLLNVGLVTFLDGIIFFDIKSKSYVLLLITFAQVISIHFFRNKVIFKKIIVVSSWDFYNLIFISILIFVLFSFILTPETIFLKSGDAINHISILGNINNIDQKLFHYSYVDQSTDTIKVGNFYPTASHYLGNIINVTNLSNSMVFYYLVKLSFSLFWPLTLYHLIRLYMNSRFSISILLFLLTLNIYPLGLISNSYLSLIYGTLVAVGSFVVFENITFQKFSSKCIFYFGFVFVIGLFHPSSIFTFVFLSALNHVYLSKKVIISIKDVQNFFTLTNSSIIIVFALLVLFFFGYEIQAYFAAQPQTQINTRIIFQNIFKFNTIEYYIVQFFNLSFTSSILMVPNFLIILYFLYNSGKQRKYLTRFLLIYIAIITSTFFAGLPKPLSYISLLGVTHYQSSIRLAHLGILVYAPIVISYVTHKSRLSLVSARKFMIFHILIYLYFCGWTYSTLNLSF